MKIAIVAGEASGDQLAAGLIAEIKARHPNAVIYGIAGDKMVAAGCEQRFLMDVLSVMGFVEVLGKLREILKVRKAFFKQLIADPPDVFVGVDAPDFNFPLERKLKERGIKTIHYVSPSVWAWRQKRVKKIARSIDLMLTLFPFENALYEKYNARAQFVGHPLADMIPVEGDRLKARKALGLEADSLIIALLPGSRKMEVQRLTRPFMLTARLLRKRYPHAVFISPLANAKTEEMFRAAIDLVAPEIDVKIYRKQSQQVLTACDTVLLASGTAALEAMLVNRPMVVSYKFSTLTTWIISVFRLIKVDHVSLPNHLAGKNIVDEVLHQAATPENLYDAMIKLMTDKKRQQDLQVTFTKIHKQLKQNASQQACAAVLSMIGKS